MRGERYVVKLTPEGRARLERLVRGGSHKAREVTRARILLKADAGCGASQIGHALETSLGTVCRTKRRFLEGGIDHALAEAPRSGRPPKLDQRGEAHLIAVACSQAPEGHDHWTLRLLAQRTVELGLVASFSHESIRQRLKKTPLSRGKRRSGAFPR